MVRTMKPLIQQASLLLAGLLSFSGFARDATAADTHAVTPPDTNNDWSVDVVPYLWVVSYGGTFGLPGLPAGVQRTRTPSSDPLSTRVSGAALLTAHVRYRDLGLFLDGAWLQLKTDGDYPPVAYSGTEIKTDIAYGTLALSYQLPEVGHLKTDLLAGTRIWGVKNQIELAPGTLPGFTTSESRSWVDPIVGARLRYDLTKHWFGTVLGDVGGFGAGSDLTWSVFGGVGYSFTHWFSATVGYRYMHLDYKNARSKMDANLQGFLLGLGFHF